MDGGRGWGMVADPEPDWMQREVGSSVADPDPGSGAFLTPGYGIRNRFFPDPKTICLRAF
jgi:hypothetical protein